MRAERALGHEGGPGPGVHQEGQVGGDGREGRESRTRTSSPTKAGVVNCQAQRQAPMHPTSASRACGARMGVLACALAAARGSSRKNSSFDRRVPGTQRVRFAERSLLGMTLLLRCATL